MTAAATDRRHRRRPARLGHQGVRARRLRLRRRQLPRSSRHAARVLPARRRPDGVRQQDEPLLRPQRVGRAVGVRGRVEAVPAHADVPIERPIFVTGLPRTGTTAIHRLLTADPAHQGLELWLAEFPQPRPPRETWSDNPVFKQLDAQFTKAHEENPDYTGLHLHDRRRGGGVLAVAAPVAAFGVLRDAGAPAHLLAVARQAGLDEAVSAAPQEPSTDRPQRRGEALGAEEPQPPVRARRAVHDLPRRAGGAVPPAGRDASWRRCARWPSTPPRAGRTASTAT